MIRSMKNIIIILTSPVVLIVENKLFMGLTELFFPLRCYMQDKLCYI